MSKITKMMLMGLLLVSLAIVLGVTAQQGDVLRVEQTVNPAQIALKGTGSPDVTTVTLKLSGPAVTGGLDLVLVLDRSASVDLERVKGVAYAFVDHLSANDRVGIVSFADTAQLELGLTADRAKARQVIEALKGGVQTALGDGLMLAIEEMGKSGRADAIKLIVLPTDGVNNVGQDPLVQAQKAAEKKLPIFPIGMSPAAHRQLLSEIARLTNGAFFSRFNDDVLEVIFSRANRTVVARFILITQTLPPYLNYEGAVENSPLTASVGQNILQLQWQIPIFFQGDLFRSQFRLSASREGILPINQSPSLIQYVDAQGQTVTMALPATTIQVGRGTGQPPPPPQPPGPQPPQPPPTENQPPSAKVKFTPASPVSGEAVKFDASESADPDGKITKYEWDWTNDGKFDETVTDPKALHPFGSAGEFTVRLRVTDDKEATAEATVMVKVVEGLRAGAAVTTDFKSDPTVPAWMSYYIDDGVVTDEEVRDANARFAADVFIPGTQYRLKADDVQAIIQINELSKLVTKYQDVKAAEADGYVRVGDFIPEVGQHYVKEAFLGKPVVYNQPPVLLYDLEQGGQLRLAGVRFISTDQNATLFQVTKWPNHPASAHFEDGTEQAAATLDKAPLKNAKGSPLAFWHPTLYGLSVWTSIINPKGLFASLNPQVKGP